MILKFLTKSHRFYGIFKQEIQWVKHILSACFLRVPLGLKSYLLLKYRLLDTKDEAHYIRLLSVCGSALLDHVQKSICKEKIVP